MITTHQEGRRRDVLRLSKKSDKVTFAVQVRRAVNGNGEVRMTGRLTPKIRDHNALTERLEVDQHFRKYWAHLTRGGVLSS